MLSGKTNKTLSRSNSPSSPQSQTKILSSPQSQTKTSRSNSLSSNSSSRSSSPTQEPNEEAVKFDDAVDNDEIFDETQYEIQDEAVLKNNVTKIVNSVQTKLKSEGKKYLFITLHILEGDKITSTIIDVFESNNDFTLKTTYEKSNSNKYFNIKNLIGVEDSAAFVSKVNPYNNTPNWSFNIKEQENQYSQVCNKIYEPMIGKECIMFYVHTNGKVTNAYYTKGGIFVFRSKGIGSTQEICDCTKEENNLDFIKGIIVKQAFTNITSVKPVVLVNKPAPPTTPVPSVRTASPVKPIEGILINTFTPNSTVYFTSINNMKKYNINNERLTTPFQVIRNVTEGTNMGKVEINNKILKQTFFVEKEDIQINRPTSQKGGAVSNETRYRFNNIMPSFFQSITNTTEILAQVSLLIKMFYVDFTIPLGSDNTTIEQFTQLICCMTNIKPRLIITTTKVPN